MSCFDGWPLKRLSSENLSGTGRAGRLGLVAAVVCAAGLAPADKFVLKSGKTVEGAIETETSTHYTVRTDVGSIQLAKSDVTRYVHEGTMAEEIEGDLAARRGERAIALGKYQVALGRVPADSYAAGRLQNKIGKISNAQQVAANSSVANEFARIQQMLQSRQYDQAEQALTALRTQLTPQDGLTSQVQRLLAQLAYNRAIAAEDAVRMDVAEQQLQAAVAADPTFYPALLKYGELLMATSATDTRGIEMIENGLRVAGATLPEGERYKYHYMIARRYAEKGEFDKAAANFAEVISGRDKFPAYADALDRTVDAYVKMGEQNITSDFQKTIQNLNNALALNPRNQKALILLGRIYRDTGQLENAIITLNRLVQMDSSYAEANHLLGRTYLDAGDLDQALKHLTMEIEAHSDNFEALLDRAALHIRRNDFEKAQVDLTAARALNNEDWHVDYLEGQLNFQQDKYAEATGALKRALTKRSDAVPVHILMGQILKAQRMVAPAQQWFGQVADRLSAMPNLSYRFKRYNAEALTELGNLDMDQNSPRQAALRYEAALQSVSDYGPALNSLGEVKARLASESPDEAARQQLMREAEGHLKAAVAAEPAEVKYIMSLATFYHRDLKDNAQALATYNLYVDKGGREPQVNSLLQEVGGQPRPEIVSVQPTFAATTDTLAMTTGTMATTGGLALPGVPAAVGVPMAGAVPAVPGVPLAVPGAGMTAGTAPMDPAAAGVPIVPVTGPTTGIMGDATTASAGMVTPVPGVPMVPVAPAPGVPVAPAPGVPVVAPAPAAPI